jgi:hypothetical protein
MTSKKQTRRAMICCATLLLLNACATASRAEYCILYRPVYTSVSDTEETKKQVDGNNAVWIELCE